MTYDLYFDVHKNRLQHRLERSQKMPRDLYFDVYKL